MEIAIVKLEVCPFCGNEGKKLTYDGKGFLIECSGCGAATAVYDTASDAIVAWNRRTGGKNENNGNNETKE